jgi:hypothetical protein
MPFVNEWRRPYEAHPWYEILKVAPLLVVLYLIFSGTGLSRSDGVKLPFLLGINGGPWLILLNPWFDLLALLVLLTSWVRARNGVYVGDAGVMLRDGFSRTVVPWHQIAYACLAQVPNYRLTRQLEPHLGLTLVAPSGEPRALPVRLFSFWWTKPRAAQGFLVLSDEHMAQLLNHINEIAARHHTQPQPPQSSWPTPPR